MLPQAAVYTPGRVASARAAGTALVTSVPPCASWPRTPPRSDRRQHSLRPVPSTPVNFGQRARAHSSGTGLVHRSPSSSASCVAEPGTPTMACSAQFGPRAVQRPVNRRGPHRSVDRPQSPTWPLALQNARGSPSNVQARGQATGTAHNRSLGYRSGYPGQSKVNAVQALAVGTGLSFALGEPSTPKCRPMEDRSLSPRYAHPPMTPSPHSCRLLAESKSSPPSPVIARQLGMGTPTLGMERSDSFGLHPASKPCAVSPGFGLSSENTAYILSPLAPHNERVTEPRVRSMLFQNYPTAGIYE